LIQIRATVKGEPDAPAFARVFDYDEQIFFSSAKIIAEKIQRKLKVNANEALMVYCVHVVKAIRAGKKDRDIQNGASQILSAGSVMIGVPETLQTITLEVAIENKTRKIILKEPIPKSRYIMAEN
jgi:urease gamma subunit